MKLFEIIVCLVFVILLALASQSNMFISKKTTEDIEKEKFAPGKFAGEGLYWEWQIKP